MILRRIARALSKHTRKYSSKKFGEKERAEEKAYINRMERQKMKLLKKKMIDQGKADEYILVEDDEIDVEQVLKDREFLIGFFNEHKIHDNEEIVKQLLKWKYN